MFIPMEKESRARPHPPGPSLAATTSDASRLAALIVSLPTTPLIVRRADRTSSGALVGVFRREQYGAAIEPWSLMETSSSNQEMS